MKDDNTEVEYKVGKAEDEREWQVSVTCKEPISEEEFAASLISLGKDILDGRVSFKDMPDDEDVIEISDEIH